MIRSAHNPVNRKVLEACDRLGMYVLDEFSDAWTSTKVDFDYGFHITEWWESDLTNMVNKDFNHPSVIMYSVCFFRVNQGAQSEELISFEAKRMV